MKKYLLIFFATLSVCFSCDEGFEELNENPLSPTSVGYQSIFNELVNSLRLGWSRQLFIHNEVLYDVTELGVVTAKTFGNIDGGTEDIWSNYYGALKNARQLENNLNELAENDIEAAKVVKTQMSILMAYKTFQMLDLFGDIPYSEAGLAYLNEDLVRPKYDDGEEVYLGLLEELRQASDFLINLPSETANGNSYLRLTDGDALFDDNLDLWIRFSNSLLLKYLVRIEHKMPDLVESEVSNILNNGYNLITEGNDVLMMPSEQGWQNLGVNWSFREHNKVRMGTTLWNLLTDNGEILDTRAEIFFETNNSDEWVPFPQIPDSNTPQSGGAPYHQDTRDIAYENKGEGNIYSSFNFYLVRDENNIPEILMTAAEVKFILAEIFMKGIGTPKDESLASFRYQEGMLASIQFWQDIAQNSLIWENQPTILSTGEMFSIVNHEKYRLEFSGDETENLRKIYTQRWIDYFRQPWEAFSLLRRTNLIPREKEENDFFRLKYPQSEINFNFDNWSAQADRMGGDENNVKIWWME